MKKLALKCFLMAIIILGFFHFMGSHLTKINPFVNFVKNFDENIEEGMDFDIFFYGSSKSYSSFNPRVFSEKLGINSYNFGHNGQRLKTTAFILEETLKKQQPELLVIEVYYQSIKSPISKENVSFQFSSYDAFKMSPNKFRHSFQEFVPKDLPYLFIKTLRNHQGWKSLEKNKTDEQDNSYLIEENNGYRGWQYLVKDAKKYSPLESPIIQDGKKGKLEQDQKDNLEYFLSTVKEMNVPKLFVTAPSLQDLKDKNYASFSNALTIYFKETGSSYLDLNKKVDSIGLTAKDFRDEIHLNNNGANKVSEYLAKWIYEKYGLGKPELERLDIQSYITDGRFKKNSLKVEKNLTVKTIVKSLDYVKIAKNEMALIVEIDSHQEDNMGGYNILFHAKPTKKYIPHISKAATDKNRGFEIWDFEPNKVLIDGKSYFIRTIHTGIEEFSLLQLGIYCAKGYNGIKHKPISIKF